MTGTIYICVYIYTYTHTYMCSIFALTQNGQNRPVYKYVMCLLYNMAKGMKF